MRLETGQVAVVTGAASGIGKALADAFAQRGLQVVLADTEQAALQGVCGELEANGREVLGVTVDVSDPNQVDELAAKTLERFGRVDVVCNNAGVMLAALEDLWEIDYLDWQWILGVNLWGVIHGLRSFVPIFVKNNHGHVVNTASLAGIASVPRIAPYTAAKHAVVGLSETLLIELESKGLEVGVTVVCPGFVITRLAESARNRPARFTTNTGPRSGGENSLHPDQAVTEASEENAPAPNRGGIDPTEVAEATLEAIEAGRLYVAPGQGTKEMTQARVEHLLADLLG